MSLAREYERKGHKTVILCRKGSTVREHEMRELPEGYVTADPAGWIPNDIDILHSHQPLRAKPKTPFLVTIHGNGSPDETYFRNTNFLSQSHARNHAAKYIVYNGVDADRYPFTETKQDYFVFLARTTWRVKNVKTAIAWANDLGVRLEIMGGSGVSRGRIRYRGLVDEPEKVELLRYARALIYPTNWDEPCAGAPLEALACGTPVIASVNGCMPELVREGTGVVCETYAELLAAEQKLSQVSTRACRQAVETFFSLERMAGDYLALLEKILREGELDQEPRYQFDPNSVKLLYKPTLTNRLRHALLGKV